jgi:hypothetical protein
MTDASPPMVGARIVGPRRRKDWNGSKLRKLRVVRLGRSRGDLPLVNWTRRWPRNGARLASRISHAQRLRHQFLKLDKEGRKPGRAEKWPWNTKQLASEASANSRSKRASSSRAFSWFPGFLIQNQPGLVPESAPDSTVGQCINMLNANVAACGISKSIPIGHSSPATTESHQRPCPAADVL